MNILYNSLARYKRIYAFSIPIILSMLSHSLVGFVDTVMVSQLGKNPLAAVGITNVVVNSLIGLLGAISPAINILMSRSLKNNKKSELSKYIWSGFYISLIIGVPITIIGVILTKPILGIIGAEASVISSGATYMKIRFLTTILVLFQFIFSNFFKTVERTTISMKVTFAANLMNIAGNYLLIFGNFGFPALGVVGAGLSTLMSYLFSFLIYSLYIFLSEYKDFFKWSTSLNGVKEAMISIIKISIPLGLEELFSYLLVPTVIMMIVTHISIDAIAANEIVINIISFIAIPHYAFSQAATTFISKLERLDSHRTMKNTIQDIIVCDIIYLVLISAIVVLNRKDIALLFIDEPKILEIVMPCLIISILLQPFDGVLKILSGSLIALGYEKWTSILSSSLNWIIYVPLAYLLSIYMNMGLIGIFVSQLLFKIIASFVYTVKANNSIKSMDSKDLIGINSNTI
ncbi:MATE family efflux transporter [Sporosalibacterium faouarense]|uniref:MATE family efflux transporter n=1 Tax=Sporosalibacterium faouarense TaxID=516123 RepID=UPI00192AD2C5|nr:MATE family efflux transporter [Sporosalibacterium faouarense]